MLSGALIFLINVVFGLFTVALLLRFYLETTSGAEQAQVSRYEAA